MVYQTNIIRTPSSSLEVGSDFSFICLHSNDRSVSVVLDNCKAGGIRSYRCLPYNIMQLFEAYPVQHLAGFSMLQILSAPLRSQNNIREIAYDRWNATMMVQALEDDGFTVIPFGQGFRDMSPPTKELMRIVLEHRLNHGGHPVLRWNFDNAYVRTDPAGNLKLDKEKSTEKIDGAVALVMALDRAMKNQNGSDSVYNNRGLLLLGPE